MNIRLPLYAGSFYESSASTCRHQVQKLLDQAALPPDLPSPLYGGLVPHAGWVFSGAVAARTFKALTQGQAPQTVVLFGADHRGTASEGEVFDSGLWETPLGEAMIDEAVASAILDAGAALRSNPRAHAQEHSLEVQLPLLQAVAPGAKIVPIEVPPTPAAHEIGRAVGEVLARLFPAGSGKATRPVCVVGSTDLTHHGGHFGCPGGHDAAGERWARANDRRMLDLVEAMDAEAIVAEAADHQNACGAGAIAATIAACKALGAARGIVLHYTNSYEVVHAHNPQDPDDTTVGYASVVFA
jgi:AmmeMemoRadiSam system protein B